MDSRCINVLQLIGYLGRGGDTTAVLNAMKGMDDSAIHIDFITHRGADKRLVEKLRHDGHRVALVEGDFRKLKLGYASAFQTAVKELGVNYDVFHAHTSLQSGVALGAAKRLGIPKRICHSHVGTIQRKANALQRFLLEEPLRHACISNSTTRVACSAAAGDYLFGRNNYELLYNGIDIEKMHRVKPEEVTSLRAEFGCDSQTLLVGQVANFSSMKNQSFVLRLANEFRSNPRYVFLFAGDGNDFDRIVHEAREMGLDNVRFAGQRDDIPQIMNAIDCLLLPSLPGEGFPMVVLEAVAAGTLCLVSDNVTDELKMLGDAFVRHMPLDCRQWARALGACENKSRSAVRLGSDALTSNGLDIETFAAHWERLYR